MRANGFVATVSSATTAKARSAAVWPARLLLGADRAPGQEPLASDEPAGEGERTEDSEGQQGYVAGEARIGRRRSGGSVAPDSEQRECAEDDAGPEPEREPTAVAAKGWSEWDPPSPTAREEVDRSEQEGQQGRDQDELDRPAANDPGPEPDVGGGGPGQGDAFVERAEDALGCSSRLADPPDDEGVECVRAAAEAGVRPRSSA